MTPRFEARELRPYAEHVPVTNLQQGEVYFIVRFLDDEMVVPELRPVVFVGRNLTPGEDRKLYFQDFVSYRNGVRYETANEGDTAEFECFLEDESSGVFDYERALDALLRCSLRRNHQERG